ncbi:MAG TPA: hypothetical protein VFV43_00485 [Limnobacter sp.]|nr:hypothetical protein [Limnobacter sp.]
MSNISSTAGGGFVAGGFSLSEAEYEALLQAPASSLSPDHPVMQAEILSFFAEPEAGDILDDD